MNDKTYGDWFSGFGGSTCGAKAAGFTPLFAFEYDAKIATVYRLNHGDHITVGDILQSDSGIHHPKHPRTRNNRKRQRQDIQGEWWTRLVAQGVDHREFEFTDPQFPHVALKHDSPPCPEFSVAKKDGSEGLRELALARKCCEYLMYARPTFYTLENVYGYRNSESFKTILDTLTALGYSYNWQHLVAADYGTPQTRRRLILIARRDGRTVDFPQPTHAQEVPPMASLFHAPLEKWRNWYEATAILHDSLPDAEFADWQKERLPQELVEFYTDCANAGRDYSQRPSDAPATTITTEMYRRPSTVPKAIIMPGSNASTARPIDEEEPYCTVGDTERPGNAPRAFLAPIQGGNSTHFEADQPSQTVVSSQTASKYRAFIMNEGNPNGNEKRKYLYEEEPVKTITAGGMAVRAFTNGRIVQMTPRALLLLQGFPLDFILPLASEAQIKRKRKDYTVYGEPPPLNRWSLEYIYSDDRLTCKGCGNAVPPPLYEAIARSLM
jgi:site-specific DNA-cytosine methylase